MKNYAVVFCSRTGNTRRLAEEICRKLGEDRCLYVGPPSAEALEADTVFAGFWTDRGDCDGEMAAFLAGLTTQRLFLFGTAGFGGDEAYYETILTRVGSHIPPDVPRLGTFMCQGQMPEAVRHRYEAMEDGPRKTAMLRNFDRALGHPDGADRERLDKAVASALEGGA